MDRVVHVNRDPYDLYIGRANRRANLGGSKWANPFRIGDPHPQSGEKIERGEAVVLYKEWVLRGAGRCLLKDIGELEGKTLGCWCARKGGVGAHDPLVCHGQILLLLVEHRRRVIQRKRREKAGEREIPTHIPVPVHRFRDTYEPTALFYCSGCQVHHPAPLIHDGPAPAGTPCDECDVSNEAPEDDTAPRVPARYIFCGSRGWDETTQIRERLQALPAGAIVVVGGARGADRIAEQVARRMGLEVEVYPARWDQEGKGAGYRRNERMLGLPKVSGVFAFRTRGKSGGTDHMVRIAREAGVPTEVDMSTKPPVEVLEQMTGRALSS